MKRTCVLLAIFLLVFYTGSAVSMAAGEQPGIAAKSSIVLEATTKRVLSSSNADQKLPMASTTKVMTALLAVEKGNLEDIVTIGPNASGVEGSSIWLGVGEKMKLEDLLYGLMLSSGNDAAVAIAEHIGGNVENFVALMNQRAKELGANNTNFVNPNGLPNGQHYTTAFDLALIAAHAMNNEKFKTIVSTQTKRIPWEGHEWDRALRNKNKILWRYDGGNGVKTGYTKEAGRCLVASAERDGMQIVSVVLNCGDMFGQSEKLLDYGFNNYSMITIYKKGESFGTIPVKEGVTDRLEAVLDTDIRLPLRADELDKFKMDVALKPEITAPVKVGDELGTMSVTLDGKLFSQNRLYATVDVLANTYEYNLQKVLDRWIGQYHNKAG